MKFFIGLLLAAFQAFVIISAETVQLESSQGILIPAPLAQSIRVARGSYGGGSAPVAPAPSSYSAPAAAPSSYSAPAPAPQSYSAPAPQSYSAPAPSSYSAPAPSSYSAPAPSSYSAPAPSSYSAPSQRTIPAPPCPRNYLFSCQPSLTPVPCSAQAPAQSGGSYASPQGAYSEFYPQYAPPVVRELY